MKLFHKAQRGGEIILRGDPLPPGESVSLKVDRKGFFEAPDHIGQVLIRVLAPDVSEVPAKQIEGE